MGIVNDIRFTMYPYLVCSVKIEFFFQMWVFQVNLQKQLSVSEGRSVTSAPVYIEHVPIYLPIFQSYPWEGLDFGY